MPLSNRIIKSVTSTVKEENGWVIDTVLDEEEYEESTLSHEALEHLEEAKQKKATIIENAEAEAEQILLQAKQEAEKLKLQAQEEGYSNGKETGHEEGYTNGLQEGILKAERETEELKQQARLMISEAQLEIEEYVEEKKESLLALAAHMAEKIVHEHLELAPDALLELVHPVLHQLDREEDFVSLTVHSSVRKVLRDKLPELEQMYPGVRFAILADETLEQGGCIVESTHKVVDLQVRKQLESMLEELKEAEKDLS